MFKVHIKGNAVHFIVILNGTKRSEESKPSNLVRFFAAGVAQNDKKELV
jgi:hypothetical protein